MALRTGKRTGGEQVAQRPAFEELHDDEQPALVRAELVNGEHVGVRQRSDRAGLVLESCPAIRIARDAGRQDFDRDLAMELGVARAVDLAHSSLTEQADDFIRTETGGRLKRHERLAL